MNDFYKKHGVLFAVLWIVVYCVVLTPIRGEFGDESLWMFLVLALFAAAITFFVKKNHLEARYGLAGWPKDTGKYLYFIPMWILATGNLWGGISPAHQGTKQLFAVLSMLLVGYVEEMIFRGFLFKALIPEDGVKVSVLISSLTFGIGHIINLFTGQASLETIAQIFFAVAWGLIFTMAFLKSGSLYPSILAHSLIDIFAKFAVDQGGIMLYDWIYIAATVIVAIAYSLYLRKLPSKAVEEA